jgi:hypothetical protein
MNKEKKRNFNIGITLRPCIRLICQPTQKTAHAAAGSAKNANLLLG